MAATRASSWSCWGLDGSQIHGIHDIPGFPNIWSFLLKVPTMRKIQHSLNPYPLALNGSARRIPELLVGDVLLGYVKCLPQSNKATA